MEKNSFIFHTRDKKLFKRLTDAEVGRLFRAMIEYTESGVEPEIEDRALGLVWDSLKEQIDYDSCAYDEVRKKRRTAAESRWKKNVQTDANNANASTCTQMDANNAYTDTVPVPDTVTDVSNETLEGHIGTSKEVPCQPDDRPTNEEVRSVVDAWNNVPDIPKVKSIQNTSTRYKMLNKRIKEHGIEQVLEAVNRINQSDFLKYGNGQWVGITFDWFLKPNNFVKVLEGNYDNKTSLSGQKKSGSAYIDAINNRMSVADEWLAGRSANNDG